MFFDPSAFGTPVLLFAAYGYAMQIYCDFSGYSDIAIGTAALLGFHLVPNFRQPYRSASLQEFWCWMQEIGTAGAAKGLAEAVEALHEVRFGEQAGD